MSNSDKQPLTPSSSTTALSNNDSVSSVKGSDKHDNNKHLKLEPLQAEKAVDAQKALSNLSPEESSSDSHGLTPHESIKKKPSISTTLTISKQVKAGKERNNVLNRHISTLGPQRTCSKAARRRGSLNPKGHLNRDKYYPRFQRPRACSVGQVKDFFVAGTRQRLLSKQYELSLPPLAGLPRSKRRVVRSSHHRGDREGSDLFYRMTSSVDMLSTLSFDGRGKGIDLRSIACQTDLTGHTGNVLMNVAEREDEDQRQESNSSEEGSDSIILEQHENTANGFTEDMSHIGNDEDDSDYQESTSMDSDDTASTSSLSGLPSIGPPNIVRYLRESECQILASDSVKPRVQSAIATTSSSEYCPYCEKHIFPSSTIDNPSTLGLCKQFCCEAYENFVKLHLSRSEGAVIMQDELIDIMPSEHYGSKAARRAARERALERLRERELEKIRRASDQPTYFQFSKPTKMIQYSLSSTKFIDEGWTIRPRTPDLEIRDEVNPIEIDVNTTFLQLGESGRFRIWNKQKLQGRYPGCLVQLLLRISLVNLKNKTFYQRLYDDGNTFLTIFPDGSGACYYPSGNLAVLITTTESGKYSYLVFKNTSNPEYPDSGMLAVFEPNGCGCCYFPEGNIRLVLNPYGGTQSDRKGNRRKKWQWNSDNWHTHAPPLHPICFSLNKNLAVRVKDQDDVVLTFSCAFRSVRFNVGAKIKMLKPSIPKIGEFDEHLAYLKRFKQTTGALFSKIEMALRFPNSPRLEKLSLPSYIKTQRKPRKITAALPTIPDSEHSVVVN